MVGIIAALLAIAVLGGGIYALYTFEPNILNIITWQELVIMAVAVLLFGLIITLLCTWISVNKFLKMTAGDLYRI
jgi:cell division transport system permease protein